MTVEIVSAIPQGRYVEVVKEHVDALGNVTYSLHIFHVDAPFERALTFDVSDPDEALDLILYEPHVCELDKVESKQLDRVRHAKQRMLPAAVPTSVRERLEAAGMDPKYLPPEEAPLPPRDLITAFCGISADSIADYKSAMIEEAPQ